MSRVILGAVKPERLYFPELLPQASEIHQSADLLALWDSTSRQHVRVTPAQLAGAGGFVFLNSVTATSSSVISSGSFASVATNYLGIKAIVSNLRVATTSNVGLRTSSDGVNYSATTAAYEYRSDGKRSSSAPDFAQTATADTNVQLTGGVALLASDNVGMAGEFTLMNLNATATLNTPQLRAVYGFQSTGTGGFVTAHSGGYRKEALPQQGFQFVNLGGGNFIDGRVDFFGIKGA